MTRNEFKKAMCIKNGIAYHYDDNGNVVIDDMSSWQSGVYLNRKWLSFEEVFDIVKYAMEDC